MKNNYIFVEINFKIDEHQSNLIRLLDNYMQDPMGGNAPLDAKLSESIIKGLAAHAGYKGFFLCCGIEYIALANCFINFSTFKARPLLNIHDFVVRSDFRGKGVGSIFLNRIFEYCTTHNLCRVNLEVREDNTKALQLYRKMGFGECEPNMFFLEKRF